MQIVRPRHEEPRHDDHRRATRTPPGHPDVVLYATAERLHLSRDGGRFWHALAIELPEISAVALVD